MKLWLMTLEALDPSNAPVTVRFSSGPYSDPAGYEYEDRIMQPANFKAGAYGSSIVSEESSYGEAVLANIDGGLDYLADYAFDGRACTIRLIDDDGIETTVLVCKVQNLAFERTQISVRLRSVIEDLTLPHPQNIYAGTNTLPDGLEGVADDIKGLTKPKVFGNVCNAEPVLVNTARYIYQVHDGSGINISAVYDRGVSLTKGADYGDANDLQNSPPAPGEFRQYQGYFRLGAVPAGLVTCDAQKTAVLLGDVLSEIAVEAGKIISAADVVILNSIGQVGIYLNEQRNTNEMLNQLTDSAGAYWTWESSGQLRAYLIEQPAAPQLTIYDYQILDISRSGTAAGENGVPVWKVTIKADQIESVQTDLAGSVSDSNRGRLASKSRDAVFTVDSVKSRHLLSSELIIDSCIRNLADAQIVAQRIAILLGVRRDSVQLKAAIDSELISMVGIGMQVTVETHRLGYTEGRDFIVIGNKTDAELNTVTLELWG